MASKWTLAGSRDEQAQDSYLRALALASIGMTSGVQAQQPPAQPSCQITFNSSPLRPRKQNSCPLSGSRRSISCTCSDRLAKPFLMSVWPVASHTRTPLGTGVMAAFQAHA
jgi:hypothetical protein